MKRLRQVLLVLLAAMLAVGGSLAAASASEAGPGASRAGANGQAASASRVAKRAQTPVQPTRAASVYLIRGFLGVFSLGLDRLNASLQAEGVKTRILGYSSWRSVVDEIAAEAELHPGDRYPLVLVGHSFGANAALDLASTLGKKGIPVPLVVTIDPTRSGPVSPSVGRHVNIYMAGDGLGVPLAPAAANVVNDNVRELAPMRRLGVNHFTMDENPLVQEEMLPTILKALGRGGTKR